MKKIFPLKKPLALALVIVLVAAAAMVYVVSKKSSSSAATPVFTVAAPSSVIDASAPNANGELWLLVNSFGKANVQLKNVNDHASVATYPVSNSATAIAAQTGGNVAVGLATASTGAVDFYSSTNFRAEGSTSLPGPVVSLVAAGNGDDYALVRKGADSSVAVINSLHKLIASIPLPAATDSIAVSPDESTIYALQGNGTISMVDTTSTKVTQSFATTTGARQIVLSPDGTVVYELKGSTLNDNVSVIDLTTKTQKFVIAAPASCLAIQVTPSGTSLYDIVGNPQFGNIQVFPTTL